MVLVDDKIDKKLSLIFIQMQDKQMGVLTIQIQDLK